MIIEATLNQMREPDSVWQHVIGLAHSSMRALGDDCTAQTFTVQGVASVLASVAGQRGGCEWLALFLLNDGRFAMVKAGFDCAGGARMTAGATVFASHLAHLIRFGLGDEDRSRLGIATPLTWRQESTR